MHDNEVKYSYILVFAGDWGFRVDFLKTIEEQKTPSNIALVYVPNSDGQTLVERLGQN